MNVFSLKLKFLAIFVGILCSLLLLLNFHFVPKLEENEKAESFESQQEIAEQLASNFDNSFKQTIAEIENIAQLPGIISLEGDNLDRILSEVESVTQFFNYFFILNPEGKWLSYPNKPNLIGKKIKNDYWVQDVLEKNATIFLDVHVAKTINTLVSGFATPIRSESGEIIAILRGVITISDKNVLLEQIKSITVGANGYVYIVDSSGQLLSHPKFSINFENKSQYDYSSFDPITKVLRGESGVTEFNYNQQLWIAAYHPIPSTGWALVVQQPTSDIYDHAKEEVAEFIKFLALSLFLTAGFFLIFFIYSLLPLTQLLKKIRSKEPIELDSFPRDEIGILAQEFNNYNKQLEDEVALQTKDLEIVNQHLVSSIKRLEESERENKVLYEQMLQAQKLESIGVLAGGIAHDFNNLLTGIMGYADLSLTKIDPDSPVKKYIEKQRQTCKRASELTKQLLSFSRKQVVDFQIININPLIQNFHDMASKIIGETINLEVKSNPEVKNIKGDKTQIEQVLLNLIVNARDAMPQGGKLLIETTNTVFDEEYAKHHAEVKQGEYVMISVTDTGHGMSPKVQEKIFDPFFTTKKVGKGTGLGMATVFGIVKQHNGYIWVYSEPEQGTTFKVYFPAVSADVLKADVEQHEIDLRGTERILLVDDNDVVRDFVSESLKFHGYQVTVESLPQYALDTLDKVDTQYDLLLTDVVMPDMNGLELSQAIRKKIPSIKIIYMSGYQDQIIPMDDVRKDPSLEFIAKPIVTDDLLKIIRNLFD